jgi:hypothetical protein
MCSKRRRSISESVTGIHGSRWASRVVVLLVVSALAVLAVPTLSLAQAPTFNTVISNPTGSAPWQFPKPAAVGDFNADGKLDALIVDGSYTVRFMRGNGDGTFAETNIDEAWLTTSNVVALRPDLAAYLPRVVDGYVAVKTADVNGDGKLDAIAVMTAHINWAPYSFVTVLTNQGNDTNGVPQLAATHYFLGFYDVRSLTVGDLNGDGKPDFIVGGAYGQLLVYLNNGDGTFTHRQDTNLVPNVGGAVGAGVIADLNGDGKADFVVVSNQAGATDIFFGNGDGTLQAPVVIPNYAIAVAVADVNNDGKPDLVEGFGDGSVSVFLNNGNGTFGSPASFQTVAGGGVSGFFISDVNSDGKLDVAVSLYYAGEVAIILGNGDGTFGAPYLYGGIPRAVDVILADFTGDGKPDIASASANGYGGQNYDVLTNTTAPAQTPTTTTVSFGTGPFVYSGSAFTATASVSPAVSGSATIVYSGNCINAGNTCSATATYAGDATHKGSSATATITINKATSSTLVTCPTSGITYNGSAQTPCNATATGAGGLNQALTPTYSNNTNAGAATASASYLGDSNHAGSSGSGGFTINPAPATVTLSNLLQAYDGTAKPVTATVTPAFCGLPPAATTYNASPTAPSAVGSYAVTAALTNPSCTGSPATGTLVIFGYVSGGGSFVIGDKSASSGGTETFWGAQWAKSNSLSGGSAPNSFKGFAAQAAATPQCGGTWLSDTGNSSGPPAAVPAYMAVVVSSSVTQSGSKVSGNIVQVVVVKTNPGYAPDPSSVGTGTIVAQVCRVN